MNLYYFQDTPYNTIRVFVHKNSLNDVLRKNLNDLSIWGGPDKKEDDYESWEFSKENGLMIHFAFHFFGYTLSSSFIK
jgi:hypothetical protein